MNISVTKIIDKMISELQLAKVEGDHTKVKQHVQAVRTLCDLVLDDSQLEPVANQQMVINSPKKINSAPLVSPYVPPVSQAAPVSNLPTGTKLEEEDANGDSLFDF